MAYLGYICNIGFFICCILIGIKGIQAKQVALGVVSIICGIVALVMAFTKQREWGISNELKFAALGLFVGSLVLSGVAYATAGPVVITR
jgi:ABC-type phosphate transport system permease subunit